MTRTLPLIAIFAMLATLCLSTTSAIPVVKRDATSTAKCVQGKWKDVRDILSAASPDDKKKAPALFKDGGEPITTAPSVEEIEDGLEKLEKYDSDKFDMFLTIIQCKA
ncbi:hypothetical protein K457DRAFT_128571 [Linnemannia elongata AG-77]|uniref:Uncharacterized protein n=1 Tax=Linnemannia elongata AG-77 TaxID=1314771 RepID=A0A197JMB6_9FUNG|nr:hypothetical protein K457DRAFT_128571 [Linnemannia elongata AG-77]